MNYQMTPTLETILTSFLHVAEVNKGSNKGSKPAAIIYLREASQWLR